MTIERSTKIRTIACPRCKKEAVFSIENTWRPFCSERCKIIDIAAWANEDYRLDAGPASDEDALGHPGDELGES